MSGDNPPWLERHAQRPHPVAGANFNDRCGDDWMKLKVPVPIDVVERQSGCPEGFELRGDFLGDLPFH